MTTQAQQIQEMEEQLNWHWRNSMKPARFFNFDGRAAWPLPLLLIYPRTSTIVIAVINMIIFRMLEKRGLTFPAALRVVRTSLVAFFFDEIRPGLNGVHHRKFKDFG
ncbi:MAG: hypothetical protein CBB87_01960 [Micavibrio sp. TMED27]|nr:MAG: hypothetical protein CBB87_01960 [Micavibrio sp. TMED27]|tara:strand:- start:436 stop:756 length:321 start_codon:yes stop_codon:yes gene_type:complete